MSLRKINGISERWLYDVRAIISKYLDFVEWKVDEDKTLDYLKKLQEHYSITAFRKRVFQIRKFLQYLKVDWAEQIKAPSEPCCKPKRITVDDVLNTLLYFDNHTYKKQIHALILLGATTGLRAEELYQLRKEDIDINQRIVYINHDPDNGQTTKTGISRVAFFNEEARKSLLEYFANFEAKNNRLLNLFGLYHIERNFRNAPIKVKDLRKFFSQEWDRKGGSTGIKKMLMGHSGDVDLNHYNAQNEDDLKRIYDNVSITINWK